MEAFATIISVWLILIGAGLGWWLHTYEKRNGDPGWRVWVLVGYIGAGLLVPMALREWHPFAMATMIQTVSIIWAVAAPYFAAEWIVPRLRALRLARQSGRGGSQ